MAKSPLTLERLADGIRRGPTAEKARQPGGGPTPSTAPGTDELATHQFVSDLIRLVPRPWGTYAFLGMNLVVFVAMVVSGSDVLNPSPEQMLAWGANFGPRTLGGDWWRLVSSTFVHVGLVHLALNMYALFAVGPMVERFLGTPSYVVTYICAGVLGSIASVAWNPWVVSAGASGSLFGLFGCLVGVLVAPWVRPPRRLLASTLKMVGFFLVLNLAYGLMATNIDMASHLGGLAGGIVFGFSLARRISPRTPYWHARRTLAGAAMGALALGLLAFSVPNSSVHIQRAWDDLIDTEQSVVPLSHELGRAFDAGELDDAVFVSRMRSEVIEPWRASIHSIEQLPTGTEATDEVGARLRTLLRYARHREKGWQLLVSAVETGSAELLRQADDAQREANRILKAGDD